MDTHCSTSSIIIPASDFYPHCHLLLNKKACWRVILTIITVIILTAVASHTHRHFKSPFGKQEESLESLECNYTWNMAYSTSIRFTVRSFVESKKNSRLYLLDWALPPVLTEKLHHMDHLAFVTYNPPHSQNTFLIQAVTHVCFHLTVKVKDHHRFPLKRPPSTPKSLKCDATSYTFHSLTSQIMAVFAFSLFLLILFLHVNI